MRKFIAERETMIEHKKRLRMERARNHLLMQKKRKEAVLLIEKARYRQLHLRELRMCRKYLKRLPYECRGVYFKFIDVKRAQTELQYSMNSFVQNQNLAREL
jgi:hypothetical protein